MLVFEAVFLHSPGAPGGGWVVSGCALLVVKCKVQWLCIEVGAGWVVSGSALLVMKCKVSI